MRTVYAATVVTFRGYIIQTIRRTLYAGMQDFSSPMPIKKKILLTSRRATAKIFRFTEEFIAIITVIPQPLIITTC